MIITFDTGGSKERRLLKELFPSLNFSVCQAILDNDSWFVHAATPTGRGIWFGYVKKADFPTDEMIAKLALVA